MVRKHTKAQEPKRELTALERLQETLWLSFDMDDVTWDSLPIDELREEFKGRERLWDEVEHKSSLGEMRLQIAEPVVKTALVTEHEDRPGEIARVASMLAGWGVNIAGAAVRRNRPSGRAVLITLVDNDIPRGVVKMLRAEDVQPVLWNWEQHLEDLDLTSFPVGWNHQGIAVATIVKDRPGQIAKVARLLEAKNLNCTGFLVFRDPSVKMGEDWDTLQLNLLDSMPAGGAAELSEVFRQEIGAKAVVEVIELPKIQRQSRAGFSGARR